MKPIQESQHSLFAPKKPVHGMHSEIHALAKDISELCGEPKRFGRYLGTIKRIGVQAGYQVLSELRGAITRGNVKNPAALFMYKTKRKPQ